MEFHYYNDKEKEKIKITGCDFYNHPFSIIYKNFDSLMPFYLWCVYFILIVLEIIFYHSLNFKNLNFDIFLNSSIAGLSLIPVLFGATVGIFKRKDLRKLVTWKKGKPFEGIIAPFVLTAIIFLIIASLSLLSLIIGIRTSSLSFFNLTIPINVIKLFYLDALLLGIFIVFGTVICIFQIYYDNVLLDVENHLNDNQNKNSK